MPFNACKVVISMKYFINKIPAEMWIIIDEYYGGSEFKIKIMNSWKFIIFLVRRMVIIY